MAGYSDTPRWAAVSLPPPGELEMIRRAASGDQSALDRIMQDSRAALRLALNGRLDVRLRRRIDPSDVIQEALLEAAGRLEDYLRAPTVGFQVWLRFLVHQRLNGLWRHHVAVQSRSSSREVAMEGVNPGEFASRWMGRGSDVLDSPSGAAEQREMSHRVQQAMARLDTPSRQILVLRYFQQLGNSEAAAVLGISPTAACNRHVRALERLKQYLTDRAGDPRQ